MPFYRSLTAIFLLANLLSLCVSAADSKAKSKADSIVIPADLVEWGHLNPLRGDQSPSAANLWGDRSQNKATGMLVKFRKGFSSPPHIHNVSYRAVVIEGLVHNDDPKAATMWMPSGSFWIQPAGEDHITAANGENNFIYLEIDSGPYLVKPSDQQFDNGSRPVNIHSSNLVWLGQDSSRLIEGEGLQITHLWGRTEANELGGSLIKLPAGFDGMFEVNGNESRLVVIQGMLTLSSVHDTDGKELLPGSYLGAEGAVTHRLSSPVDSLVYIRSGGNYQIQAFK